MESNMMLIKEDHEGLQLFGGPPDCNKIKTIAAGNVRVFDTSKDGKLIAYSHNNVVRVEDVDKLENVFEAKIGGVQMLKISPKNNFLFMWTTGKVGEDHNSLLYDLRTGNFVQSMKQKQSQGCLNWTDDESVCVRFFSTELHFYEKNDFTKYVNRFSGSENKVADYSISTCIKGPNTTIYFATLCLGLHAKPNFVRLYRYPEIRTAIANKSFFRTNRVAFKWSPRGDALLILCSSDEDKTGKSYYGEQSLNYLDASGISSSIALNKEGPVHFVEWHPSTKDPMFVVVYGFCPAKAALFNTKCQIIHDFGEVNANQVHFNYPFGNLLALSGYGNLRGGISIFNFEKKVLIAQIQSPDTTKIEWAPDGFHLLTAVTAPRMRVGNCYKIWNYTGKLIYEEKYPDNDLLTNISWRPNSEISIAPPKIIESSVLVKTFKQEVQPVKYVPPHMRKAGDLEKPKPKSASQSNVSEKEKKLKSLEKKLDAIKKLKETRKAGGRLEKNQLEKISKEKELLKEMEDLKING